MDKARELKNARAALRGFNTARGARYARGDEADLADLLTALMVLAAHDPNEYGPFDEQLGRATRNYNHGA